MYEESSSTSLYHRTRMHKYILKGIDFRAISVTISIIIGKTEGLKSLTRISHYVVFWVVDEFVMGDWSGSGA